MQKHYIEEFLKIPIEIIRAEHEIKKYDLNDYVLELIKEYNKEKCAGQLISCRKI